METATVCNAWSNLLGSRQSVDEHRVYNRTFYEFRPAGIATLQF